MRLNIFVLLVLALFAAGVAARTHSRPSHYADVDPKDPAFLKLDLKIKSQYKVTLGTPITVKYNSQPIPATWFVMYKTDSGQITSFNIIDYKEGNYVIKKL